MTKVLMDFIAVSPIQDRVCPLTSAKHTGLDDVAACKPVFKSGRHSKGGVCPYGQEDAPIYQEAERAARFQA